LRLWWLRLDFGAGSIVEARRAIEPEGGDSADAGVEERLPGVGMGCDGTWHLAYLVHRSGRSRPELRIAPVGAEAPDGGPKSVPPGRVLAEGCLPLAPASSPDGRRVHAAVPVEGDVVRIVRLAVFPSADDHSGPTSGERHGSFR
jgi:hypothetical protein